MKIRDQIQETDFIFALAEGKVTVQTKDLKGIKRTRMKRDIRNAPIRRKASDRTCALSVVKESNYETKTDKGPGFVSSAIHRTTCFKAH